MKSIVWILGVSLAAFLTLGVTSQASAQGAVINSIAIDTNGDLPGFLELFKRTQAIAKRLGNPAPRVFQATLAGEQTNDVVISIHAAFEVGPIPLAPASAISFCHSASACLRVSAWAIATRLACSIEITSSLVCSPASVA